MSRRVTTTDFIQRARKVHGSRYDYSKSVYVAARTNVTIICPEHGEFEQRPANHCIGHGCHECGGNKPLTLDRFIERAGKIHKGRYDYSRVEFLNVESKVEIICPDHGSFRQRPASHLKGFGCGRCGRVETAQKLGHSRERFLEDARRAHGDRYDYSQVTYLNALSYVTIVCPVHGAFQQRPANHTRNIGCPKCGTDRTVAKRTKSTEYFVRKARETHGDRYDYSKVEYKSAKANVEIHCAEHGSFWQLPLNHLRGIGCPDCAESGFKLNEPGVLYYVAVTTDDGGTLYKIGVTNLSVERRFPTADLARIRIVKTWRFNAGRVAAERESEILSRFATNRYHGSDILTGGGNTELFTRDVLGLDRQNHGQSFVDRGANRFPRRQSEGVTNNPDHIPRWACCASLSSLT